MKNRWSRTTPSEWILLAITLGTIVSQAFVPRDMSKGEAEMLSSLSGEYVGYSISRAVTAAVLLASVFAVILGTYRRALSVKAAILWLAYLAWFVGNYLLNSLGRDPPASWARCFHQPVVMAAFLLTAPPEWLRLVRTAKLALLAFIYGAIAGAIIAPEMAMASNYEGFIPGVDIRLYGIGGGAISLASCCVMFLLLEIAEPAATKLRWVHLVSAVGVLLLTQAKTAWVFLLLAMGVAGTAVLEKRVLRLRRIRWFGPFQWASMTTGAVAYLIFSDRIGRVLDYGPTEAAANLSTLTGRTSIWGVSFQVFLENPWFGYGPGLWAEPDFWSKYGQFMHSHNQLLQTLAGAGLFGAAGLVAYSAVLIRRCGTAASWSLAPAALLAWIGFEGLTDVPLRSDLALDAFFVGHSVLVLLTVAAIAAAKASREAEAPGVHYLSRSLPAGAGRPLRGPWRPTYLSSSGRR